MSVFDFLAHFPQGVPLTLVDVGAAWSGPGFSSFETLVRQGHGRLIGFEPDPNALAELQRRFPDPHRFSASVIGDGQPATFHTTQDPVASSLLHPNHALLDLFQQLGEMSEVVNRTPVATVRLDDALAGADADFLKIDVQGAEALVLAGAPETLQRAVCVEIEVEFVPMYEGQPLFADIDPMLRAHGFVFHRFLHGGAGSRVLKPITLNGNVTAIGSQTLWADAVYVRDFTRLAELPAPKLVRLAALLHELYGSYDMAAHVMKHYDQAAGAASWPTYLRLLATSRGALIEDRARRCRRG